VPSSGFYGEQSLRKLLTTLLMPSFWAGHQILKSDEPSEVLQSVIHAVGGCSRIGDLLATLH